MRALVFMIGLSACASIAGAEEVAKPPVTSQVEPPGAGAPATPTVTAQAAPPATPAAPAPAAPSPTPTSAVPPMAAADVGPKIKVGGQLRLRSEYRDRLKPDAAGATDDALVGQRARASVGVGTEKVRALVEVQDARNWGSEASTVSNDHNADLHQAYLNLPDMGVKGLSLTVGRQELIYGDERLLGALDWATVGRSFDGGVVRYAFKSGMVDGIAALVNDRRTSARGSGDMILTGAYGRFLRGKPGRELDLYALNLTDGAQITGEAAGRDTVRITTLGARARRSPATGFLASAEAAYQLGHQGPDDHKAYAWAVIGGYTFGGKLKPAVRFEWDGASGDGDPKDGESREFNNLFHTNHGHYGYVDILGWRNMNVLRGTLAMVPRAGHQLSVDVLRLQVREAKGVWKDDAGAVIGQDPTGKSGREVGDELDLLYRFPLKKDLVCLLGYSAFVPGHFAETVRGKGTQSFAYAQVLFKF
jgi:hypothetical protein